MHALLLCLATAAIGIEAGWERLPEGGMRYIINIEPQSVDAMKGGDPLESDIPAGAGEIRAFRLVMGKKLLPHDIPPATAKAAEPKTAEPKMAEAKMPDRPLPSPAPRPLMPDPGSHALGEQQANYQTPPPSTAAAKPATPAGDVAAEKPAVPWLPLTATLLGLIASLSANVFLGWVTWDARQRLRKMHGQLLLPQV
jgi:hypothetical protein